MLVLFWLQKELARVHDVCGAWRGGGGGGGGAEGRHTTKGVKFEGLGGVATEQGRGGDIGIAMLRVVLHDSSCAFYP